MAAGREGRKRRTGREEIEYSGEGMYHVEGIIRKGRVMQADKISRKEYWMPKIASDDSEIQRRLIAHNLLCQRTFTGILTRNPRAIPLVARK